MAFSFPTAVGQQKGCRSYKALYVRIPLKLLMPQVYLPPIAGTLKCLPCGKSTTRPFAQGERVPASHARLACRVSLRRRRRLFRLLVRGLRVPGRMDDRRLARAYELERCTIELT